MTRKLYTPKSFGRGATIELPTGETAQVWSDADYGAVAVAVNAYGPRRGRKAVWAVVARDTGNRFVAVLHDGERVVASAVHGPSLAPARAA